MTMIAIMFLMGVAMMFMFESAKDNKNEKNNT